MVLRIIKLRVANTLQSYGLCNGQIRPSWLCFIGVKHERSNLHGRSEINLVRRQWRHKLFWFFADPEIELISPQRYRPRRSSYNIGRN